MKFTTRISALALVTLAGASSFLTVLPQNNVYAASSTSLQTIPTGPVSDQVKTDSGSIVNLTEQQSGNLVTVTATINGVFQSKAVRNLSTGDIVTTFKDGKTQTVNEMNVVQKIANTAPSSGNQSQDASNSISPQGIIGGSGGSSYYNHYLDSAYNSGVNETGYLWDNQSVTDGPLYQLHFIAGTAIATVASALVGVLTGSIGTVLIGLGITTVGSAINEALYGSVYSISTYQDLAVYSQGQIGLKTHRTIIDVQTHNSNTGVSRMEYYTTQGDQRTDSDLCIAGAYNVATGRV